MLIEKIYRNIKRLSKWMMWGFVTKSTLFPTQMFHIIRPYIWKKVGVNIGHNVGLGYGVYLDVDNAKLLTLEDDVLIAPECYFLMHRRDLSVYNRSMCCHDIPHIHEMTLVKKGAQIGSRAVIMPGVTIGRGAVIGAGSIVVKDIPDWAIAVGNPAKVISYVKEA